MQTIKELLFDAVKYQEALLAHAVFYAVQKGIVGLEEQASKLDYDQLDLKTIQQMVADNTLAMDSIKLYAIPLEPGTFAFILSRNSKGVEQAFIQRYGRKPGKILDMTTGMDRSLYFEEKNKHMSFRDIKDQVQTFPYFVCEFQKT